MLRIWISYIGFLILSLLSTAAAVILDPECGTPLGMQSGLIKEEDIIDTGHSHGSSYAYKARLNGDAAWCIPSCQCAGDGSFRRQYVMEINLKEHTKITAIAFQGAPNNNDFITYGEKLQIAYYNDGNWLYHNQNNVGPTLQTQNLKNSEIEYYVLDPPIEGTAIKIQMRYDGNPHCLRTELYGCKGEAAETTNEYKSCSETDNPLMLKEELDDKQYFNESYSLNDARYGGKSLLFGLPFAWCVQGGNSPYAWTSINLRKKYIVYAVQVNGYMTDLTQTKSVQYLAESFSLEYSLDEMKWSPYYGGQEMNSSVYLQNPKVLATPFAAKFVKISIKVLAELSCIKLQLFGCDATSNSLLSTTILTPPNVNASSVVPLEAARIYNYDMTQGTAYNGIDFKDSNSDTEGKDGIVRSSQGCLIDYQPYSDPLSTPKCWIGWSKIDTPDPYIELFLNREATLSGISIVSYVDKSAKMNPFSSLAVYSSQSKFIAPELVGYGCPPSGVYSKDMEVVVYTVALDHIVASMLKLEFDVKESWLFIRNLKILQDEVKEGAIALTSNPVDCKIPEGGKNAETKQLNTQNVVIIICIVLAFLFIILLVYVIIRYRHGLHHYFEVKAKGNGHVTYLQSRSLKDERLMNSLTPNALYEDPGRLTPSSTYEHTLSKGWPSSHSSVGTSNLDQLYAAPSDVKFNGSDVKFNGSIRSSSDMSSLNPSYLQVGHYSPANSSEYAKPDMIDKQYEDPHTIRAQYTEPNAKSEPIYAGSAIYASNYQNPYSAIMTSSLYADPTKVRSSKKSNVNDFPREKLIFKEKIGVGQFGEVRICEASGLDEIYSTIGHYSSWGLPDTGLVAVKVLKQNAQDMKQGEFVKEVNVMARLKHQNVVRLLGVCHDDPKLMVVEYMENGDLNMFLRNHVPYRGPQDVRVSQIAPNVLLQDTLLHMSTQIVAGMKYLHDEGFVHRDLATRNCLVGPAYQVKIADFGMSRHLYSKQYYRVEGKAVLPIRWMAPECLYYGTFTPKTDVWSFGVTLWEILTFAQESPYNELSDQEVIENACQVVLEEKLHYPIMDKPDYCPGEVYTIMVKCWRKEPDCRPSMADMYQFFKDSSESSEGHI